MTRDNELKDFIFLDSLGSDSFTADSAAGYRPFGETAEEEQVPLLTVRNLVLALLLALVVTTALILTFFHAKEVHVIGNTIYTNDEMEAYVESGRIGDNTFLLSLLYHDRAVRDLPFVESVSVTMLGPGEINVIVHEKELVGYIPFQDENIYINREGVVMERSAKTIYGVPCVSGVEFADAEAGKRLETRSEAGFRTILHALNTLRKYDVSVSKVSINENGSVTADYGDVQIILGTNSGYDLKVVKIRNLLNELEGRSGVINLTTLTSDTKEVFLQKKF